MGVEVRDNPDEARYEVFQDGDLAGFVTYRLLQGRITLVHTEVVPAFEGRGLASALAVHVLADIRERGLVLTPVCPFFSAFIRKHPDDYLDLVDPAIREKVMADGGHA
jgi:predicted GNAT family acetyltransferase